MTTFLSFLCNEPVLSSCHPRRNTNVSENEYLIDSESWENPQVSQKITKNQYPIKEHYRQQPLQRLISFVSALNPLKKDNCEAHKQSFSQTGTISRSSYNSTLNDEDCDIQHFAIVDIVPGGKPLFISDARHSERSKWLTKNTAQSFDVALRRRRSLSCARMNRRAYSLNKMAQLDASARVYSRQRTNRRPESSFIDAKTYNDGRTTFYTADEDVNFDQSDLYSLEWNHPARNIRLFFESTAPPRPPKRQNSHTYINEIRAPPRPPPKTSNYVGV